MRNESSLCKAMRKGKVCSDRNKYNQLISNWLVRNTQIGLCTNAQYNVVLAKALHELTIWDPNFVGMEDLMIRLEQLCDATRSWKEIVQPSFKTIIDKFIQPGIWWRKKVFCVVLVGFPLGTMVIILYYKLCSSYVFSSTVNRYECT